MLQPGGMYWLAAQAPAELQAQHPLAPVGAPGSPSTLQLTLGPTPTPVPSVAPASVSDRIQSLIAQARTWLGVRYAWGGCDRSGVDCSCFVLNVLATIGVHVPRTTVEQKRFDRPVSRDQLQPGDTLFFNNTCTGCGPNPTHEGLYIGAGLMIDAGDPVQVESITTAYWQAHYDSAGRPPGL
jgi:cell wall-associated NlpC family hydrolase